MQASEAVPFLSKPPRLDSSMPGYAGFDPLRISDTFDVNWLRVRINFCQSLFVVCFEVVSAPER
jgi:hypothetical protein